MKGGKRDGLIVSGIRGRRMKGMGLKIMQIGEGVKCVGNNDVQHRGVAIMMSEKSKKALLK